MTISTATANAQYDGNGTTQIFTVPFYFLVDTDVKVSKLTGATGAISVLTLNSDYTLTGAGNSSGGSATMVAAPLSGDQLFIERNVSAVQETAYPENGYFPAASHERALDRLTMLVQQLQTADEFTLTRNPLADYFDVGANRLTNISDGEDPNDAVSLQQLEQAVAAAQITPSVPSTDIALLSNLASTAAGKGASLVGYGTGTVKDQLDTVVGLAGDSGATKVAFKSTLAGAIRLTLQQLLDGTEIHSSWFGPDKTGVTSATAALQACVTAGAGTGKKVVIDPGTYAIGGANGILIPSNTTIIAYGAKFNRATAGTEIMRNDADGVTGGYLANSNIAIYGGTYDGRYDLFPGTNGTLLAFGHCTGVTVKDATLQNTTGSHYIEFNASKRCLVDNCLFFGGAEQGLSTMEAIQIDAALGSAEFPWFGPYDNTPCDGVVVRDSVFLSCGSGVGTHTDPANQHVNISILGNTFKDTYYAAIRGQGWSGVVIANNRINGGFHGVFQSPAAGFSCNNVVVANNTIENIGNSSYNPGAGALGRPIVFGSVSGKIVSIVSITGNTVRNSTGTYAQHGIYLNATQKFSVVGNIVDSVNGDGIYCDGGSFGEIVGNHSTLAAGSSFRIGGSASDIVLCHNRGATASITGSTKCIYKDNILATSSTVSTMTSSLTTPNLVNGTSV